MTLILSIATHEYLVQVSDRQLTWLTSSGADRLADDDSNKIVLFCGRMAFGYTGLAKLENMKTDLWLTKILAESKCVSGSDACNVIRSRATEVFQSLPYSHNFMQHAFVGIGWTISDPKGPFRPIVCVISNAIDTTGAWLAEAREDFRLMYRVLPDSEAFQLNCTGAEINEALSKELLRTLKKIVKRKVGPAAIARVLVDVLRKVATKDTRVGENLLIVSMPKIEISQRNMLYVSTAPSRELVTFLYVPAKRTHGVQYGPNVACGGVGLTNFKAEPVS